MEFPRGWVTRDSGDRIKLNFVNSGILKGEWYIEVPVGFKAFQKRAGWRNNLTYINEIAYFRAKRIDLVCIPSENNVFHPRIDSRHLDQLNFNGKRVWLIETKKKLDYCALGQVLVYKHLFLEDWEGPPPFRKDFDWGKYVREKYYNKKNERENIYFEEV